ncbi:hypothetical protein EVAR_26521_1 [Eumeta japonica]|uniref:Suppressor of white apricot N-terminal domain-containing protein n=1 Tax=Eumeta variegata TaxID=151549 RepID=A0A4C1V8Q2_EUMVA|nr:hypothetical protein EVAR_26521_1 [Eumeta japonica]
MWHEARKQERMIRGMIVDYRRRAERRKDFYEKIKAEPTQFLQLHGRQCKIHLDPAIAAAGDSPAIMMPWQGDSNNLIDRFDVRAHLDFIPEVKVPDLPPEDLSPEERQCNYERYRILAQNVFLGIGEDKFLQQLAIEEQFGVTIEEKEAQREKLHEKKGQGAAIGYNYSDPSSQPSCSTGPEVSKPKVEEESDDDSDLEIIDVDLSIDVNKMEASQAHELNAVGPQFGMAGCDLFSFLTGDADDAEHQKQLIRDEKEKAMFSGRKSRRERRAHRDKKLATRVLSPPSYAALPTGPLATVVRSPSPASRTPSPAPPERIQFITSFGGDDEPASGASTATSYGKSLYADKVKHNLKRMETYSEVARGFKYRPKSPYQEDKDRRYRHYRQTSRCHRSRSPQRSRLRYSRSRSRSRSRSYSPRRRRSRSRSHTRNYKNRSTSRSPTNHGSGYARHNDSRSMSYESTEKPSVAGGTSTTAPIPRYYGRRKEDKDSSSELDLDSDSSEDQTENKPSVGANANANQSQLRLTGSSSKGPSRETLTLKMKLKRKMQAQLSKQLRADKRAEAERQERESRRLARRDEEMRELAIKLRRKQREMRHQQNMRSSEDSDGSRSRSSSRGSQGRDSCHKKSRSKSNSPTKEIGPVWELNENLDSNSSYSSKNYDVHESKTRQYGSERYKDSQRSHNENNRSEYTSNYSNRHGRDDRSNRDQEERDDSRKYDNYQSAQYAKWDQDRDYSSRRSYGERGLYRGSGRKYAGPSVEQGCEGPPHWQSDRYEGQSERRRPEKQSAAEIKNRIKLVDY